MAELYIFNPTDENLGILSEGTGLLEAPFRIETNRLPETPFSFTFESDSAKAVYIKEENQVVFRDHEGDFRLFSIREIDDADSTDGAESTAICEPAFMELNERIIVDKRLIDQSQQEAIDAALEGTRWTGIVEVDLGIATTNFYYISAVESIWKTLNVWGGEFKDVVEFDDQGITSRKIKIIQRLGSDTGQRFEIDHNIESIKRTVLSYPLTALYGRGGSVPYFDEDGQATGGYTRFLDFASVAWSTGRSIAPGLEQGGISMETGEDFEEDALNNRYNLRTEYMSHRAETLEISFNDSSFRVGVWRYREDGSFREFLGFRNSSPYVVSPGSRGKIRLAVSRHQDSVIIRPSDTGNIQLEVDRSSTRNPVNKPAGQRWIGHPQALQKYGREHEGELLHREGIWQDQNIDDPEELLRATWEQLQKPEVLEPEVHYQLSVHLFDKKVSLGDTARAIDRVFSRPIEIQTRIIAMEYDLLNIEDTMTVEMGQFLSAHSPEDEARRISADLNRNRGRWDEGNRPISSRRYPDRKPPTPVELRAEGGFKTNQLYWTYADEIFLVKHYEVYGSQVQGFNPDSQHLLWRGQVSAFGHQVDTDQVWYYRVRAVNYHDRPSDWSEEVSAATERIISDDMLFGEEMAARLRELHDVSKIIGGNGVDFDMISEAAKQSIDQRARDYTDEEIQLVETELKNQIAEKAGFDYVDGQLQLKADQSDVDDQISLLSQDIAEKANLDYVDGQLVDKVNVGTVYTISEIDNKFDNVVSVTEYETDMNGVVQSLSSQESRISQNETDIQTRVERTEFENLQIGGRNLLRNGNFKDGLSGWGSNSDATVVTDDGRTAVKITQNNGIYRSPTEVEEGQIYTVSFYAKALESSSRVRIGFLNQSSMSGFRELTDEFLRYSITFTGTVDTSRNTYLHIYRDRGSVLVTDVKLEKGNKATDWTPAPEDVDAAIDTERQRITTAFTEINQNADEIQLKASQSALDSLTSAVSDLDAELSVQADRISARVTQQEYEIDQDGIVQRFESNESIITTLQDQIELRVEKETFDALEGRVSSAEGSITANAGAIELRATKTEVSAIDGRLSQAESSISILSDEIELRVEKDEVVSAINLSSEGVRIKGSLIHLDGLTLIDDAIIQTVHIENGAISRLKLGTGVVGTLQVENGAITNAKIASLNADKINATALSSITANLGTVTAGILESSNNNIEFNLNNGTFDVYSNASIRFNGTGGGMKRIQGGSQSFVSYAISAGNSTPMISIGTLNSTGNINVNNSDFRGIRLHATGVSISDDWISSRVTMAASVGHSGGAIQFDMSGTRGIVPLFTGSHSYRLGSPNNKWDDVHADNIRAAQVYIRNPVGSGGWSFDTQPDSGSSTMTFRGINSGTSGWNYNLGTTGNPFNFARINHLRPRNNSVSSSVGSSSERYNFVYTNSLVEGSDKRIKDHIRANTLGLSFINTLQTVSFELKETGATKNGLIAQDVLATLNAFNVHLDEQSIVTNRDDVMGISYTQLIAPTIKAVQELTRYTKDEINDLKLKNQLLQLRVSELENKIA